MRIVFAGTPEAAVPSLSSLAASDHDIVGVVTRRDAEVGRKRVLTPSPVAERAGELGVPVIKANRLRDDETEAIAALAPDLGVIVAYGGLVREPLLSLPRLGWINLHFSLLPRWRGAAPVQHAILAGDDVTGAQVFQLVADLDAGDVLGEHLRPLGADETAEEVLADLAVTGADLLVTVVDSLARGDALARPQSGEPTLAPKLSAADGRLDWSRGAHEVYNRIRAMTPEPGAFTHIAGVRVKVLEARIASDAGPLAPGHAQAAADGVLVGTATAPIALRRVQPAGKRAMAASDWWRGLAHEGPVIAE
ncbi:methionyl-tRNA formyltransferase [Microbacterium sp. STN6]|uniref:methionyl-tRNA formyltransferase n=1 Tax=Microbacterium sp. STN6 TaxID=2995588 RepID=UPI002260DE95|nr:methionyl-tRNA formyltransferase [Microbacterium sp. STN6]MCX7521685.1 methionyl-tRNA formyltransferase [Microbacterium sp. STN6]